MLATGDTATAATANLGVPKKPGVTTPVLGVVVAPHGLGGVHGVVVNPGGGFHGVIVNPFGGFHGTVVNPSGGVHGTVVKPGG